MKPLLPRLMLCATLCASCTHTATNLPPGADLDRQPGSYLAGSIAGACVQSTLDQRDFTYDLAIDRSSQHAAFSHLASNVYRLAVVQGAPDLLAPVPPIGITNAEVNTNDLDVEALAFAPDGKRIAVASHDRTVRLFDLTGRILAQVATESALTSVAFAPDGRTVVVGSSDGLLTVLSGDDLSYQSELRSHTDEVRALAFDDSGTLWSGSFDQRVRSYNLVLVSTPISEMRLRVHQAGELTGVSASLPGGQPVTLGFDERLQLTTITPEAAQRAGIDVSLLKDHLDQLTPGGTVRLPVAKDQSLIFKTLTVPHVDLAICGACVPAGSDGVLGQTFIDTHSVALDPAAHEVILHVAPNEAPPPKPAWTLRPAAEWAMPGFVADLTVSRDGTRLGVALDTARPERNLALYKREKAGEQEPQEPGNVVAMVDARSGKIIAKHGLHHGVVWTAAISPDGRSIASGGWDRQVLVFSGSNRAVASFRYGWSVRKVRFSPDGRLLGVAAWTPQNAQNADSAPAAQLIRIEYANAEVRSAARAAR